jgi:hypothetical protein
MVPFELCLFSIRRSVKPGGVDHRLLVIIPLTAQTARCGFLSRLANHSHPPYHIWLSSHIEVGTGATSDVPSGAVQQQQQLAAHS